MTDLTFFGVWNGFEWTTEGKLDYSIPGLSDVKEYVMNGDYISAKSVLLTYYRNRKTRIMPAYPVPSETQMIQARLEADDFCFTWDEYPLGIADFSADYSTVSTDVSKAVNDVISRGGQICFMLMGRDYSENYASIYGRECSGNKPQLVVTMEDGGQKVFYPEKTAYIRGGVYSDVCYGSNDNLEVQEAGLASDSTRRSYLVFDLANLVTGSVQSASLDLYGRCNAGTYSVVVLNSGNTGFNEKEITWNNTMVFTCTFTGIGGGNDWNAPENAHNEYVFSITRFYFIDNIIPVYLLTKDEYYAKNLIRIWLDFINDKGNENPMYPRSLDTAGRTEHMIQGYHFLKNSLSLDGEANTEILKLFWGMANELIRPENYHAESNWGMYESKGLYWISLYFPEFKAVTESGGWIETSRSRFTSLISNMLYTDGSYYEATSGYPVGVAENFKIIKEVAFLNHDSFCPDYDERLLALSTYIMDFCRPDGCTPAFGDADGHSDVSAVIKEIAQLYPDRTDLLYFGSKGQLGEIPDHTSTMYPAGRLAFMKTGYDVNDMYMCICLADGCHAHSDLNSVTAYAYGRNLLVDPGVYSYNDDIISNWFRKKTSAHNTIEINNTTQIFDDEADDGMDINKREITDWCTNNVFDFYEGKNEAYPGFKHFRDVLFLRGGYWIVSDYITAPSGKHTYNQTWHFLPNANVSVDSTTKRTKTAFETGANIQVIPADPCEISGSVQSGYYSAWGGSYTTADYVSFVKEGNGDITFDAVLFPTQEVDKNWDIRVTRLTTTPIVPTTTATAFKIDLDYGHNGNIGCYYLSHATNTMTEMCFGTYSFSGKAAYVETDSRGSFVQVAVKSGTLLKNGSTCLISSPETINDIGVNWKGTTLEIYSSQLSTDAGSSAAIAIYAPFATTVTLNGNSVGFTKKGNYIYAV